jgi:hypothetical protein
MDSVEQKPHSAHFEIATRCDSCKQRYQGKATVGISSRRGGWGEKAQVKLDKKIEQVLSGHKGVGVQRCPYCGHIQAWNLEETADVYARWWTLGITALVFGGSFVFTYAMSGLEPDAPDIWLNLLKLVGFPLITLFLGVLILRPVSRGFHMIKYSASENYKPEIRVVDE